jgi:hypothetical protein
VKDESAFLAPAPAHDADAPAGQAHPDPTIVHLPLYRPGTLVSYQGQTCSISHVVISRSELKVYLRELGQAVDASKVHLSPTRLVLQRH